MLVYVIDVGSGNIRSVENALTKLGYEIRVLKNAEDALALDVAERVLLPGVGNFGHFVGEINARGLAEPIKRYIASGRPIMGICVGLQALFAGSAEAPGVAGLELLPGFVRSFDSSEKSVPHIGWSGVRLSTSTQLYGVDPAKKYYFVHSYARIISEEELTNQFQGWSYALGQYGSERFVAALGRKNAFFTQFHPEKSGDAGLQVFKAFLEGNYSGSPIDNSVASGLSKRVIACLDVRTNDNGDLVVTKGDQYDVRDKSGSVEIGGAVRNLGKPVEVAERYYKQGADEITFLNITSFRDSPIHDQPMLEVLRRVSETVFVPLTIGGGIRDSYDPETKKIVSALDIATLYFRSGADKVSIGSDAVIAAEKFYESGADGSSPIETISRAYGSQAVVVSIDPRRVYVADPASCPHHTLHTIIAGPNKEEYVWYQCTIKGGRESRPIGAYELAHAVEQLGAGEILLNCIDKDGTNSGFDLELINDIKAAVSIPVIASSGAGNCEHFAEVFAKTPVEAALGAGMFHRNEYTVEQVKRYLQTQGEIVRL